MKTGNLILSIFPECNMDGSLCVFIRAGFKKSGSGSILLLREE